jgi:hypothetical protein
MSSTHSGSVGPKRTTVEVAGRKYRGTYKARGGSITVWYRGREKSGSLGSSAPEAVAAAMLSKLVRECRD